MKPLLLLSQLLFLGVVEIDFAAAVGVVVFAVAVVAVITPAVVGVLAAVGGVAAAVGGVAVAVAAVDIFTPIHSLKPASQFVS